MTRYVQKRRAHRKAEDDPPVPPIASQPRTDSTAQVTADKTTECLGLIDEALKGTETGK